jgi:hypothetical protein
MHRSSFCALVGALAVLASCGTAEQAPSSQRVERNAHAFATSFEPMFLGWGSNLVGEARAVDTRDVIAIAAGGRHTVALRPDGTVVAWGYNSRGQTNVPTALTGVIAIAAGYDHTVVLKSDGTVRAWGENLSGQSTVPYGLYGVTAIAAGARHTLALKGDGKVVAWGTSSAGQATVPVSLSGVTAIGAGLEHSLRWSPEERSFHGAATRTARRTFRTTCGASSPLRRATTTAWR